MKYLIGVVAFLVVVSFEAVFFASGVKYGQDRGYRWGYAAAVQEEHDARLSFILDRMAFYESSYNVDTRGDFYGTRYRAYGLYQFHRPTFMWLARLSGNPKLDWRNPEHQHQVVKWAIQHGYGFLWSSYRLALHDYFTKEAQK